MKNRLKVEIDTHTIHGKLVLELLADDLVRVSIIDRQGVKGSLEVFSNELAAAAIAMRR